MLEGVGARLTEAIGRRDMLRTLYEDRVKSLNETSSSLREAEEVVQRLLSGSLRAQNDVKMLQRPMHPIRRCLPELIQCIFELVVTSVSSYDKKHLYATQLSSVSYKWRDIAIHTPSLWDRILVSVESTPESIQEFWTRTLERIKLRPASIYIEGLNGERNAWEGMKQCRLDLVPHIKDLTFLVDNNAGAECFLKSQIDLPMSGITKFAIGCHVDPFETLVFDPSIIFTRFPALNSLTLSHFDFSNFTFDSPFEKITDFSIANLILFL
jgi:hypothetical protein